MLGQEREIERVVVRAEERPRPAIATLRDMMRYTGNDDASQTGHGVEISRGDGGGQLSALSL